MPFGRKALRAESIEATLDLERVQSRRSRFDIVDATFRLNRQQSRGAWFLPTEASLRPGTINFPANFQRFARFASNLSWEEHCKASLEKTADALLVWALLEPLFEALFEPFMLRGRLAGNKSREDQRKRWHAIDSLYQALGFEV